MSAVGKIVRGRARVRCDGCGRISSDRNSGHYEDRETGKHGNITGKGRECEHDFCDECEDRLNGLDKEYRCCKCGRQPVAYECGSETLPAGEPAVPGEGKHG